MIEVSSKYNDRLSGALMSSIKRWNSVQYMMLHNEGKLYRNYKKSHLVYSGN